MALWVSFSDWTGRGSPLSPGVGFVGLENYAADHHRRRPCRTELRHRAAQQRLVRPAGRAAADGAVARSSRYWSTGPILRGRGFFRTAFYFPSVTSSVAITVLWLFLFSASGAVNEVLSWVGINGPNWFNDPRGILHIALGEGRRRIRPGRPQRRRLPRPHLVGLALRTLGRHERVHPHGDLHHQRHLHAPVPRRAAEHRRRARRSGDDGRRQRVAALLAHHPPAAAPDPVHRAHARR